MSSEACWYVAEDIVKALEFKKNKKISGLWILEIERAIRMAYDRGVKDEHERRNKELLKTFGMEDWKSLDP